MSDLTPLALTVALFMCCICCSLIIAVPLNTAGYNRHAAINKRLVNTTCQITDHEVLRDTCWRDCNCHQVCTSSSCHTSSSGSTSCSNNCHESCDRCPYTCWKPIWHLQFWKPLSNGEREVVETTSSLSSKDSLAWAEQALNERPIGTRYSCFYDPKDRSSGGILWYIHNLLGFQISMWVFYSFAMLGGLGVLVTTLTIAILYIFNNANHRWS